MLSEGVSKLPLKLIRSTPERGVEEVRENPALPGFALPAQPHPDRHLLLGGHGDVPQPLRQRLRGHLRQRGKHQLWHMRSDRVSVWFDNRRILGPDARLWYIWSAPDGRRYKLCQDEVLHFRTWLSLDGITGLSVQGDPAQHPGRQPAIPADAQLLYKNGFTAKAAVQYTGDLNSEAEQNFLRGLEAYATGQMDATKSFIPCRWAPKSNR